MIAELSPFRKLFNLGYTRLVPIVPPDATVSVHSSLAKRLSSRGKAVGIKGDDGHWRGFDWLKHVTSEQDLDRWASMGAGVGIRTGNGIVALDIDSLDPFIAKRAADLAYEMLGKAPLRIGKAPKCLLVYRTHGEVNYQRVEFSGHEGKPERIELLSDGRQFVAEGIHPGTNRPYHWPTPITPQNSLSTVTPEALDAYFTALASSLPKAVKAELSLANDRTNIDQSALTGDSALVTAAVTALPNTSELFPTYDDYIRVGAAIKGATQNDPQHGLELFLEWCSRWDGGENDEQSATADFNRIKPPYELGAKWLYDHADRYSGGQFNLASAWFEPVTESENPFAVANTTTEPRATVSRFTPVLADDAAAQALTDSQQTLIKGLLDQGAMTVLYGASNVGKTFVAMDIAYAIAAGVNWAGMRTTQKTVLYVAAEGGRGAKRRAKALQLKYKAHGVPFYLIMDSVDMLRPDADLEHIVAAARTLPTLPGLVVIDTLSRAIAGGDENSSTDMGALVKNLDTLRSRLQAHVLTVHHTGKDAAKGARGHSLLRAATDTEIEVADSCISVTKQRDMDGSFKTSFKLASHELGLDADGDPVTSCSIDLVAAGDITPVESATATERELLEHIAVMVDTAERPDKGVTISDILSSVREVHPAASDGATRQTIKRLATKCLLKRLDKGRYTVNVGTKRFVPSSKEHFEEIDAVQLGTGLVQSVFE